MQYIFPGMQTACCSMSGCILPQSDRKNVIILFISNFCNMHKFALEPSQDILILGNGSVCFYNGNLYIGFHDNHNSSTDYMVRDMRTKIQ